MDKCTAKMSIVIPYKDTSKDKAEGGDVASTMSTTLPMVAVSHLRVTMQVARAELDITDVYKK